MTATIYSLNDPRDFSMRYVGMTRTTPQKRLATHLGEPCSEGLKRWFSELETLGLKPIMFILETCPHALSFEREIHYVALWRSRGVNLLNVLRGGNGPSPEDYNADVRAKMSLSHLGKKLSQEHRAKMSAAKRGIKITAEHRANISAGCLGKKRTPEGCANIGKSKRKVPKATTT